jgi:hypothetical protein
VNRVAAVAGALVAVAVIGCTGDGSAVPETTVAATTTSSVPPTAAPATTIPSLADTISLRPAGVEGVTRRTQESVITDAAAVTGGPAVVAGRFERAGRGVVRPFVIEPRPGGRWRSITLPLDPATSGGADAVTASPGGAVAAGTVRLPDGGVAPASWVRAGSRWSGPFPTDAGAATAAVAAIAAGPAGVVMIGRAGERRATWVSADGRLWNEVPSDWEASTGADAVAVGEDVVVFVVHELGDVSDAVLLVGPIGGALERIEQAFGLPGTVEVGAVATTARGFVAVGGASSEPGGDRQPAVWRSPDGRTWRRGRGAVPPPAVAAGSRGTTLELLDAGRGGLVAAAEDGQAWRSTDGGRTFAALPRPPGDVRAVATAATPDPLLASPSQLFALTGATWTEAAAGVIEPSAGPSVITGIAGFDGAWYAVGSRSTPAAAQSDGLATSGAVWRSDDGQQWELIAEGGPFTGLALADVSVADGWLIAVGTGTDGAKNGVAQILRSRDGRRWRAAGSPDLAPPAGGTYQLEAVAPGPERDAAATGLGFDGVDIRPLVLRIDADGNVARSTRGLDVGAVDGITLGACTSGGTTLVVGQVQGTTVTAQAWTSADLRRWQPVEPPELTTAESCAGAGEGRFAVAGRHGVGGGLGPAAVLGPPDAFVPIAIAGAGGAPDAIALSNDVVVIAGANEADAVVWVGDRSRVESVEAPSLAGPGHQSAEAVAIAGGRLFVGGQALGQAAIWVGDLP